MHVRVHVHCVHVHCVRVHVHAPMSFICSSCLLLKLLEPLCTLLGKLGSWVPTHGKPITPGNSQMATFRVFLSQWV